MKQLYFIRHGESTANVAKLSSGHADSPLTPRGRAQAAEAGRAAREAGLVFDVILSSPLKRAHHTAIAMADLTNHPINKIETHDIIKERYFGELENKNMTSEYGLSLEDYMSDPYAIDHIPNVEKIEDLHKRVLQALEFIQSRPEETILIVSHGAFGRVLQRAISNASLHDQVSVISNAKLVKLI